jgi:CRISPR system Cascade subunit CasE
MLWMSNPYRVHQRLKMACGDDPRLLFRIETGEHNSQVLVQTHNPPNWTAAFGEFDVLSGAPEFKPFDPALVNGNLYRFRLLANPTAKITSEKEGGEKHKTRLGILREANQAEWLKHKLAASGAELVNWRTNPLGLIYSHKNLQRDQHPQVHYAVLFEGVLKVADATQLRQALQTGIGSAKGFGFGLLSLAPVRG